MSINGRRFPSAWGSSKKEAEQRAALRALQELRLTDEGEAADEEADLEEDDTA